MKLKLLICLMLILSFALTSCTKEENDVDVLNESEAVPCWDLNGNKVSEGAKQDINNDGVVDEADCAWLKTN